MISAVLLSLALDAATLVQHEQPDSQTVVVTGERLRDLRAALAACIARRCPPNEDVDASLAVAEAEFVNGDYDTAHGTIRGSLRRNGRFAETYPEPVADLFRSSARVLAHMGRDDRAEHATRNILSTLQRGIPTEDHRHFTARLEMAEFLLRHRNVDGGRRELGDLAQVARRAGRVDVAKAAEMRLLRLDDLATPNGAARRRLVQLSESTDPALRYEMLTSRLYLAARYREAGDTARADALLAAIPRPQGDTRALLYSPPYQLTTREHGEGGDTSGNVLSRMSDVGSDEWIDVAYWITPDGRVSDLEVVRSGRPWDWARPLLASIGSRRYSESADGTASYRLERYTYTSDFEVVTGSRIPTRSRRARVEVLDLTAPTESGRAPETRVSPNG